MPVMYCPECGFKNQYTLSVPNFCGGCGSPLGNAKNIDIPTSNASISRKTRRQEKPDLDDDETDINEVPDIRNLEYEVSQGGLNIFKGADLLGLNDSDLSEIRKVQSSNKSSGSKKKTKVRRQKRRN